MIVALPKGPCPDTGLTGADLFAGLGGTTNGSPYVCLGNKREQMAQYGNGVTPEAMEFLVGCVLPEMLA